MTARILDAVAIPAYQAAETIAGVARRAALLVERVVVVDDGSTDGTGDAAHHAGVEVLRHDRNRGKGSALRTAFEYLFGQGFERILTLDADGQHLPEQIPRLVEAARAGGDLVIGSRDHLFRGMHGLRRASNLFSSLAISALVGARIPDAQSGFRLYSRRLYVTVGLPESRFDAESAVVIRAVRRGFGVISVPIELGCVDGRRTSHYRPLIDSLRIVGAVVRARTETTSGCPAPRSS